MNQESKPKDINFNIVQKGKDLILPESSSLQDVVAALNRKITMDEQMVRVWEEIDCFPLEGAYAFSRVLTNRYGWADAVTGEINGVFGKTKIPPITVNLEIAHDKSIPIFWGFFMIPGVDGQLQTSINPSQKGTGKFVFVLQGECRQKHRELVKQLVDETREFLKVNSIYKGKAIRLRTNDDGTFNFNTAPVFMDTTKVKPEELIFSDEVNEQVETNIFTPIEKTDRCREAGIPLKMGVLLESTYGTGKTMTANVTAHKAEKNGWTFIYLDRVSALREAISFAREYQPAVLFAEDIDRVMSGERDMDVDDILNIIDGVDSKKSEIMVILTTNDVKSIEKAMLRPGRLDAVISIQPPDAKAAERLMRMYGRNLIEESEDLMAPGKELSGQIPAVIREVVERSKRYAISRDDGPLKLTGKDLLASAKGMKSHLSLLKEDVLTETVETKFSEAFKGIVSEAMNGTKERISEIHEHVMNN